MTLRCEEVGFCSHHPPALSRSLQLVGGRGRGSGCVHRLSGWWRLDLPRRERGGVPDTSRPSAENAAASGMSAPTTVTPLTQTPASCLFFLSGQGWGGGACPSLCRHGRCLPRGHVRTPPSWVQGGHRSLSFEEWCPRAFLPDIQTALSLQTPHLQGRGHSSIYHSRWKLTLQGGEALLL